MLMLMQRREWGESNKMLLVKNNSLLLCAVLLCASVLSIDSLAFTQNDGWNYLNLRNIESEQENMLFFPHRASTGTNQLLSQHDFDNAGVCKTCHQEIYKQWQSSMMAQSWDDPIYRALLKRVSQETDGALDNFCTGCHSPIGLTTGKINAKTNQTLPGEPGDHELPGVDCESCHNISGRIGIDNGAYVLTPKAGGLSTKFGPRKNAKSPYHETAFSPIHQRSDFCAPCHNVTHPFNNVPIERTYNEWLESPYAVEGTECQDCHMQTAKGRSAVMGPERDDIASHHFAGANSTVLRYFGFTENAENARKMLRSAARVSFVDLPQTFSPGQQAHLKVKVENINAGHKLPTGFPEGREMWLDLRVLDKNKQEIYRLGRVQNGKTEAGTRNFKVHLGDKQGNEVDIEVWKVTHIISDNRLLPRGYQIVDFAFDIPSKSKGPYSVIASLKYWPFSQALVDELLGEGKLEVDIVDMAEVQTVIAGSEALVQR